MIEFIRQSSVCSLGCSLVVVEFIQGWWSHLCVRWGSFGLSNVAGFIRVRHVGRRFIQCHWGAYCGPSGSSAVAGSIGVGPGGGRLHPGPGIIGLRPGARRVHPWSLGSS